MNENDYRAMLASLDRALAHFEPTPTDPGVELDIYEELKRARETLIRTQRDLRDKPKRDSRSPVGS